MEGLIGHVITASVFGAWTRSLSLPTHCATDLLPPTESTFSDFDAANRSLERVNMARSSRYSITQYFAPSDQKRSLPDDLSDTENNENDPGSKLNGQLPVTTTDRVPRRLPLVPFSPSQASTNYATPNKRRRIATCVLSTF
jgi:hypothetical protein